ncbi:AAA family ATPase [Streptomyces sp. RKAG293]|uniref:AAA family ATPase n=1 Tax=Streptomyces sp. RKAG293 TaxID=2893403 RepID=UPI0025549AE4|nr:LuxR family transcriptional regulator [Streptomyces sp. RKAG293]
MGVPQSSAGPPAPSASQSEFLGRRTALRRLRAAAADAREGVPSLLVLQGMPGVGKTTLLRHFLAESTDFSSMTASAVAEERNQPFALLDRLTARVDQSAGVSRSPGPTSRAPADRTPLNAGADILRLIDDERRHGPLAVIVDDADWADPMSVRSLAFALRRLWRDRVLTLIAVRNWPPDWDESAVQALEGVQPFSRLTLGGFSGADIARMAVAVRGRPLSSDACERLLTRTQGHPLYVRTLLAELPPSWEDGPVDAFPMPADLSAAVLRQVTALPSTGRQLVEALSVLDGATPLRLLASVAGVRDAASALDGPVRAGLLDRPADPVDPAGPVAFRHALQREAVRLSLAPALRRRLHLAAAGVLDPQAALVHQVAAADGPDPALAERLRELSVREAGESRLVAAATHLLWAAQVAGADQEGEEFLFRAVRLLFWAGMDAELLRHRAEVLESRPSPLRDESRALLEFALGRPVRARPLLIRARNGLPPDARAGDQVAIDTELAAVGALIGDGAETERTARAALDAAAALPVLPPGRPRPDAYGTGMPPGLTGTAGGFAAYGRALTSGAAAGLTTLAFLPERPDEVPEEELPGLVYRGILRGAAGRFAECEADLTTAIARARPDSVRILGLSSRIHLCICHFMSGNWARAARDAEIGLTMVEARGRSYDRALLYSLASTLAAAQGEWRNAERDLDRGVEEARGLDYEGPYFHLSVARAALARCRGDHDSALDALRRVTTGSAYAERSRLFSAWWQPLHVEALVNCGRPAEARRALALLIPDPASVDPRNGALTVARAWLGGRIQQAEGDLPGALACYSAVPPPAGDRQDAPLYTALLRQSHGSCLAAAGETEQAVAQLRSAERILAALGAAPFLDRCRADLAALGGTAREDGTALDDLSAREREVARLVGRGHTNREIAAALFLSAKTIEYHLRNVFAKTRVHNRRELRDLVQDAPWEND